MILALDPGLATCGWAIVAPRTGRVVDLGVYESEPDRSLDESTDRARRALTQSDVLARLYAQHDCKAIAAEAMSFGGAPKARFMMAVSLCLSWGVVVGLSQAFGCPLYEVTPKLWQRAVLPEAGSKVDYDLVFDKLSAFVMDCGARKLSLIRPSIRNHALDAVGVGVFAALMPATAITLTKGARA